MEGKNPSITILTGEILSIFLFFIYSLCAGVITMQTVDGLRTSVTVSRSQNNNNSLFHRTSFPSLRTRFCNVSYNSEIDPSQGKVVVFREGSWNPLCVDSVDGNLINTVCRYLGRGGSKSYQLLTEDGEKYQVITL